MSSGLAALSACLRAPHSGMCPLDARGTDVDRSGNRRSPPPVRRTTLLYLGVATGALTLRRYGLWRPLHCGLTGQLVTALAATPEHPEAAYAASGGAIFHSADGGARWRRVGAAPNGARVWALLAGPR